MLNHIMVGKVLTVDDQTKARLETKANIKSHQICTPKSKPGKIIIIFVAKAKNSTVLALFQYALLFIDRRASSHCVLNLIFIVLFL